MPNRDSDVAGTMRGCVVEKGFLHKIRWMRRIHFRPKDEKTGKEWPLSVKSPEWRLTFPPDYVAIGAIERAHGVLDRINARLRMLCKTHERKSNQIKNPQGVATKPIVIGR